MGGFFETERMKQHVEQCAVCQAAHAGADFKYAECCDEYGDMFENVVDFENNEGPWEDREDWEMCPVCDGPVPFGGTCEACKTPHPTSRHYDNMTAVAMRFRRANGMTQEFVEEQWSMMLRGFDGEPVVWQEGVEFEMKAYFLDYMEAARFAAHLTKLTGVVAEIKASPRAN